MNEHFKELSNQPVYGNVGSIAKMLEEIIQLIDTSINKAADLIIFCNDCLYAKVHLVITVFFL